MRLLLVRFSSIGDLLLATPLIRALRTRHPQAEITFVTRSDMVDVLATNPHLTRIIGVPRDRPITDVARELRQTAWSHRLDLHGSLRSLALRALVPGRWTSYPKERVRRRLLIASKRRLGGQLAPVADRYFHAARGLDVRPDGGPAEFRVSDTAAARAQIWLQERGLGDRPLIALAPGAAHFTKRWPVRHWASLAEALCYHFDIIVVGGAGDIDAGHAIAAAQPERIASAAGVFPLEGTAALLRRADRVVAGDTGVLHLATAVGTPVVGLYGPTVREFGFFPYHAAFTAVEHDLDCRPCSAQGGPVCPLGHHHCLERLDPATVVAAIGHPDAVRHGA